MSDFILDFHNDESPLFGIQMNENTCSFFTDFAPRHCSDVKKKAFDVIRNKTFLINVNQRAQRDSHIKSDV